MRIVDAAGALVQSLRPLNAPTRDSGSDSAVIREDRVHCYAMSVHARLLINRDEPLLRIADYYSQIALHRVNSPLAKACARVSDQRDTNTLSYTRTPV